MSVLTRLLAVVAASLLTATALSASSAGVQEGNLPRFTEEREAAALCFLRKNAPELLTVLEQLKKENLLYYRREIRAVFQVTEMLADLDDERRHDLELEIWKVESKAHTLAASLPNLAPQDRRKVDADLQRMARELVELDIQVLELKAEQAEKEVGELREELGKAREQVPAQIKARYDRLLEQGRKRRKTS